MLFPINNLKLKYQNPTAWRGTLSHSNFPLFFCYLVACYFNTFSHYHLSNHAFGDYVTMSVANAR
jgi:hypothetical protein